MISARVRELRERRTEVYNQASQIIARAAFERREMTADESESVDRLHDECERLRGELREVEGTPQPTLAGGRQRESDPFHGSEESESADQALGPEQRCADYVRSRRNLEPEQQEMNVGRFLRSMFSPRHRTEAEQRALSEGSDSAGGHTVPDFLSAQLVDLMRARSQAVISGARTVPLESNKHTIAKLASDPSPGWRAENAAVAESDPTFEAVEFQPKSLAVFFKASQELIQDSSNLESELPGVLAAAMAAELDRAVFLGSGASNEPLGIDGMSGVQEVAHNAALENYTPFIKARRLVMDENVDPNVISNWVMAPVTEQELGSLVDTTGQPLMVPPILNQPRPFTPRVTSKIPEEGPDTALETTIYGGAFNQVVIGMRLQVNIRVLTEIFAENLQVAFMAYLRADVQAIRPKQLVKITGIQV